VNPYWPDEDEPCRGDDCWCRNWPKAHEDDYPEPVPVEEDND
jgi:hypothetical protein